jgi:hypothetical protein
LSFPIDGVPPLPSLKLRGKEGVMKDAGFIPPEAYDSQNDRLFIEFSFRSGQDDLLEKKICSVRWLTVSFFI